MKQFSTFQHTLRGSLTILCFGFMLFAFQAKAQVYASVSDNLIQYTDITTLATQISSPAPKSLSYGAMSLGSDGKYAYMLNGFGGSEFLRWDRVTDTWTILADCPVDGSTTTAWYPTFDGNHTLYAINASFGGTSYKYDIPTNTWTTFAALPTVSGDILNVDVYTALSYQASTSSLFALKADGKIYKYSIPNNTWTLEPPTYGQFKYAPSFALIGSDQYAIGEDKVSSGVKFVKNTTPLTPPPISSSYVYELYAYKGKLYTIISNFLYEYDPVSNTWTKKNGISGYYYGMVTESEPAPVPTVNLSLAVLPTTQTANKGETISYTYTLTSAGNADGVIVKVRPPKGLTLLSNTPQQGTYNPTTQFWSVGTVTAGTRTLVLTLKVD